MTKDQFIAMMPKTDFNPVIKMIAVCTLVTEKQGYVLVTATTRGVTGVANYWNAQSITAGTTLGFKINRAGNLTPACSTSNDEENFIPIGVYLGGTSRNLNVSSVNPTGAVQYQRMPIRINFTHKITNYKP